MGAGKLRVLARTSAAAAALAVAAGGCGSAASSSSLAPGQTPPPVTPSVTPSAVPALGQLTLGTFRATKDGENALQLCESWAGLRGQYVARVAAGDTSLQLERWFSSAAWQPAFTASGPLLADPAYYEISTAFGIATVGQTASIAQARRLDAACAAAD